MHTLLISLVALPGAGKNLSPLKSLGLLSDRLGAKSRSDLRASPFRILPLVQVVRRIHQHWLVKAQIPLFWRTSCHTQWNL